MIRRVRLLGTIAFLFVSPPSIPPRGHRLDLGDRRHPRRRSGGGYPRLDPQVRRRVTAGENGAFRFAGLPPGHYDLQAMNPRFGSAVAEVDLADGAAVEITIRLDLGIHSESVVVTASPEAKALAEVAQPVSVLDPRSIQAARRRRSARPSRVAGGCGDLLLAGGAAPSFAASGGPDPGPRERGRIGRRFEHQSDHAVTVDAMMADRIEIVRGPASLLYGNAAVGGVVNVLDGRIPDHRPGAAVTGDVQLRVASAADERATGGRFGGDLGNFAWNVLAVDRRAGDLETPDGLVANSDLDATTLSAGTSWIGDRGFVGVAFTDYTTNYGAAVEDSVRIDLDQSALGRPRRVQRPLRSVPLTRRPARLRRLRASGARGRGARDPVRQ